MRAAERMRGILNATGLYKFTGETPGDWELNACGAGFDALEDACRDLLAELFAASAPEARLAVWEVLFQPQPASGKEETRREVLLERLAAHPQPPTAERLGGLLKAAGIAGAVREGADGLHVCLGRCLNVTEEEAVRELSRLLPSHLPWVLEKGVTWAALDAHPRTFVQWDGLDKTWAELDAMELDDLEQEEKNGVI